MRWLWEEREMEKRGYTELRMQNIEQQVFVDKNAGDPSSVAAVQACAGTWARAMSAASIEPDTPATRVMTASFLYDFGRSVVMYGEALYVLSTAGGRLHAQRATDWDVEGIMRWKYRATMAGPSGTWTRHVDQAGVLHPRINVDPAQPHRGRSGIAMSGYTAALAASIEKSMSREARANNGYVLPSQTEGMAEEELGKLRDDLKNLDGNTAMVPILGSSLPTEQRANSANWQPRRIGMTPPGELVNLRSKTAISIFAAAGCPAEFFTGESEGTGRREAWRQFLHGSVQPVADILAEEMSEKLETEVSINFDRLFASDIQGRGRAFQSLTAGGMDPQIAARVIGISDAAIQ